MKAMSKHCKPQLEGETFFCSAGWNDTGERLPEKFRWLVAFAVEGESEGWYVHVGAIVQHKEPTLYKDFGHAKVWSAETAYAVQKEAQRFLTAARWN